MTTEQILLSGDEFTDRLHALRSEARQARDLEQVKLCTRALEGDETARRACAEVMAAAEAAAQ